MHQYVYKIQSSQSLYTTHFRAIVAKASGGGWAGAGILARDLQTETSAMVIQSISDVEQFWEWKSVMKSDREINYVWLLFKVFKQNEVKKKKLV